MDTDLMRLILLVAGVVLIAGIYWWGRVRRRADTLHDWQHDPRLEVGYHDLLDGDEMDAELLKQEMDGLGRQVADYRSRGPLDRLDDDDGVGEVRVSGRPAPRPAPTPAPARPAPTRPAPARPAQRPVAPAGRPLDDLDEGVGEVRVVSRPAAPVRSSLDDLDEGVGEVRIVTRSRLPGGGGEVRREELLERHGAARPAPLRPAAPPPRPTPPPRAPEPEPEPELEPEPEMAPAPPPRPSRSELLARIDEGVGEVRVVKGAEPAPRPAKPPAQPKPTVKPIDAMRAAMKAAASKTAEVVSRATADHRGEAEEPERPPVDPADEKIIALHVTAPEGHAFAGQAVLEAVADAGLVYGDLRIFHRLVDNARRPLFSLANMVKPGWFDPDDEESLTTPGLTLFLRLPGPLDGVQAFDQMYATARRLAEELEGDVRDPARAKMTKQTAEHIRDGIRDYQLRQTLKASTLGRKR